VSFKRIDRTEISDAVDCACRWGVVLGRLLLRDESGHRIPEAQREASPPPSGSASINIHRGHFQRHYQLDAERTRVHEDATVAARESICLQLSLLPSHRLVARRSSLSSPRIAGAW